MKRFHVLTIIHMVTVGVFGIISLYTNTTLSKSVGY